MTADEAVNLPPAIYSTSKEGNPHPGPHVFVANNVIYALNGPKKGHLLTAEWAMRHEIKFSLVQVVPLPADAELIFIPISTDDPSRN